MSEDREIVRVVAMRADEVPLADIVPGAIRAPCGSCGEEVWIAPSSQRLGYDVVLCWPCARVEFDKREGDIELRMAPGAAEELKAALRRPPPPVM